MRRFHRSTSILIGAKGVLWYVRDMVVMIQLGMRVRAISYISIPKPTTA